MKTNRYKLLVTLGFCQVLAVAASCTHGPPTSLARFNPFLWRQRADDRQYGPAPYERLEVLQTLAERGGGLEPENQDRLARDLARRFHEEQDPLFRAAIVRALAPLGSPAAVEGMQQALDDSDPTVRIAACEAWERRGGPEALQALSRALNSDTHTDVRLTAARHLGAFRGPEAVQALGLALDDPDPALQHRAVRSLTSVTGRDLGDNVPAWREYVRRGDPAGYEPPSLVERVRRLF